MQPDSSVLLTKKVIENYAILFEDIQRMQKCPEFCECYANGLKMLTNYAKLYENERTLQKFVPKAWTYYANYAWCIKLWEKKHTAGLSYLNYCN